jgi:hypothetical protein
VARHCCSATRRGAARLELEKMLKSLKKNQQVVSKFCRKSAATTSSKAQVHIQFPIHKHKYQNKYQIQSYPSYTSTSSKASHIVRIDRDHT